MTPSRRDFLTALLATGAAIAIDLSGFETTWLRPSPLGRFNRLELLDIMVFNGTDSARTVAIGRGPSELPLLSFPIAPQGTLRWIAPLPRARGNWWHNWWHGIPASQDDDMGPLLFTDNHAPVIDADGLDVCWVARRDGEIGKQIGDQWVPLSLSRIW